MAIVNITNTKLTRNEAATFPTAVAVDATAGAAIDLTNKSDGRILIIIQNIAEASKTATIKAGNGLQGVEDLEITVAASTTKCIVIESGKYKNVTGDNKGKVIIKGTDANIKIAVVELP